MTGDYIYTDNMAVGYGRVPLIRQIKIHVKRGEIVTLIGPNGSGKSTILKSIIRQLGLVDGAVYLAGSPMCDMTEKEIATKMSVLMTERIRPGAYDLRRCGCHRTVSLYRKTGNSFREGQAKVPGRQLHWCMPGFC